MRHLAEGKIGAFMSFPPEPQELRARKIGHVMVNTMLDRPWSQYFCCIVAASREFIRKHPVATKRALRAILKAADVCTQEPKRVARFVVDKGYTKRYGYALQAIKEIPYNKWREYDSEDSVRFFSLRLPRPRRESARMMVWANMGSIVIVHAQAYARGGWGLRLNRRGRHADFRDAWDLDGQRDR